MKTKVIFRTFPDGGVIALFPEVPTDPYLHKHCLSYMNVGQHGAASVHLSRYTRPSSRDEVGLLKGELESIGYDLEVVKRFRLSHHKKRGGVS